MKKLVTYSAIACFALAQAAAAYAAGGTGMAASAAGSMTVGASATAPSSSEDTPLADGVVQKVDRQNAMVTLKHGEIKSAGMPAMTMAYKAQSAALIGHVKEGEKVRFRLENVGGAYLITTLEKR